MTLNEIWEHYDRSYAQAARSISISHGTIRLWKLKGWVPFKQQKRIEALTDGKLVANPEHDRPGKFKDL